MDRKDALNCREVCKIWKESVDNYYETKIFVPDRAMNKSVCYPVVQLSLPLSTEGAQTLEDFTAHQGCKLIGNRLQIYLDEENDALDTDEFMRVFSRVPHRFWQQVENLEIYSTDDGVDSLDNDCWQPVMSVMTNVRTIIVKVDHPLDLVACLPNAEKLEQVFMASDEDSFDWDWLLERCKENLKVLYIADEDYCPTLKNCMKETKFSCLEEVHILKHDFERVPLNELTMQTLKRITLTIDDNEDDMCSDDSEELCRFGRFDDDYDDDDEDEEYDEEDEDDDEKDNNDDEENDFVYSEEMKMMKTSMVTMKMEMKTMQQELKSMKMKITKMKVEMERKKSKMDKMKRMVKFGELVRKGKSLEWVHVVLREGLDDWDVNTIRTIASSVRVLHVTGGTMKDAIKLARLFFPSIQELVSYNGCILGTAIIKKMGKIGTQQLKIDKQRGTIWDLLPSLQKLVYGGFCLRPRKKVHCTFLRTSYEKHLDVSK